VLVDSERRLALIKGLPPGTTISLDALPDAGWNILRGDTGTPVALLKQTPLRRNLATMAQFCRDERVALAPHVKTHMSPALMDLQLGAGAWGVTVAVPHQLEVVLAAGATRVIVANEITDLRALTWIAERSAADPALELCWYVDSLTGVSLAEQAFSRSGVAGRVVLEMGHAGGRTGVRTQSEARQIALAVKESSALDLTGIGGYEGTIGHDRSPVTLARVAEFLRLMREVAQRCHDDGLLPRGALITAGGSAYFDQVTREFGDLRDRYDDVIVLRSGSYLTHDNELYEELSPDNAADWALDEFSPSIEVWGCVVSRPEAGKAFLNVGRRDVAFDAGLPIPLWLHRGGDAAPSAAPSDLTVIELSDQHAWLSVPTSLALEPGDLVGLGISHPCTTFDKWHLLYLVDDAYSVVGAVTTHF
jgi:D-serine dehydratase